MRKYLCFNYSTLGTLLKIFVSVSKQGNHFYFHSKLKEVFLKFLKFLTVWKVSSYRVFSGPYFLYSNRNTYLSILRLNSFSILGDNWYNCFWWQNSILFNFQWRETVLEPANVSIYFADDWGATCICIRATFLTQVSILIKTL